MPVPSLQEGIERAGSAVKLLWGEHPGGDVAADADLGFRRIRASVQPSPYNEYARSSYRASSVTA